jgi:hypothetical protein
MTIMNLITDFIGTPNTIVGEVILYTLAAVILLAVIEEIFGFFHAVLKVFKP